MLYTTRFDVVIPARNEASFIENIINFFHTIGEVNQIIVVDNASNDETSKIALSLKAKVITESKIGKGFAVKTGLQCSTEDYVFVCDADVRGLTQQMVKELMSDVLHGEIHFCRAAIQRESQVAPVTELVVKPLFNVLIPELSYIQEPLGGIFACNRKFLLSLELPDDWGFDVALTMDIHRITNRVHEKSFQGITHRIKSIDQYLDMSQKVIKAVLAKWQQNYKL